MLFQVSKNLLPIGIGDLSVDAGVLDVLVTQVVGHVLDPAAGFQEMHGHGMTQGVHRSLFDADRFGVIGEELLHLALLQGPLATGEEIRSYVSALAQIAAYEFGCMPPQGLFSAEAVFQPPDGDPMILGGVRKG
jgi:hypothetical protein